MTVLMKNPGLPEAPPARTTQEAFDAIWKGKGWVLVDSPEADQSENTAIEQIEAPAPVTAEPSARATKKTEG